MSYTLSELAELTEYLIQNNKLNSTVRGQEQTAHESFPLIHWILIGLSQERNHDLWSNYIELLEKCLIAGANPNILDSHGKTPLHYCAVDFPDILTLALSKLFIHYRADPNLLSSEGMTPFELGLMRNARNKKMLQFLASQTQDTERLREKTKEIFDDAYESNDVHTINRVMEFNLVEFDPNIETDMPPDFPESFKAGFWIRSVSDLDRETSVLNKRADIRRSTLERQRHKITSDPSYTTYSPATFVCPGVPVSIFSFSSDCGVMIRPRDRTIPYWYDGLHGEQLTREMNFSRGSHLSNGHHGQHWEITEEEIAEIIRENHRSDIDKIRDHQEDDSEPELDNYGVLLKKQIKEISYSWNEGLFRYKKEDIFGIYVNPNSKESCHAALTLREKLRLNTIPLYSYNDGNIVRIHSKDIIARWFPRPASAARTPQAMFAGRIPASAPVARRPLEIEPTQVASSSQGLHTPRR